MIMLSKFRLPALLLLLLLAACRAGGPGTPARTVASFFSKYEGRDGFKTADWSADLLDRLALVKAAKLLGGTDFTDGITGIRSARVIGFAPTTAAARALSREGLRAEATGILQNEKYEPLVNSSSSDVGYQVSVRGSGDKISEFAAIGQLPDVADSFVLVSVNGNFTRSQVQALTKYLPNILRATAK